MSFAFVVGGGGTGAFCPRVIGERSSGRIAGGSAIGTIPSRKIWNATYMRIEERNGKPIPAAMRVQQAIDELHAAFVEIAAFAREVGQAGFAEEFQKAADGMRTRHRRPRRGQEELAPDGFASEGAMRISSRP